MKRAIRYLLGLSLIAMSCDDPNPLDAAWSKFGAGDYPGAHAEFSSLVGSEGSGAYVGLGWTAMKMDSLPESDTYFGLASGDSLLEGFAGWSILAWLQGQHVLCIDRAEYVFRNAGGYSFFVFPYDPTITYHDLLLHEGFSYYHTLNFSACINIIQRIDPSFSIALNDPQLQNILLAKLQSLTQEYD
ncbi:hypothetical protein F9K33_12385 [bacterium]|nr:MAG: hypothetical protein F9K33_12385 [bacterium]